MKRLTFNLNKFISDLDACIETERYDLIHDTVQTYKDFLEHCSSDRIKNQSKSYVENHYLVTDNEEVRSYITACHKPHFRKVI